VEKFAAPVEVDELAEGRMTPEPPPSEVIAVSSPTVRFEEPDDAESDGVVVGKTIPPVPVTIVVAVSSETVKLLAPPVLTLLPVPIGAVLEAFTTPPEAPVTIILVPPDTVKFDWPLVGTGANVSVIMVTSIVLRTVTVVSPLEALPGIIPAPPVEFAVYVCPGIVMTPVPEVRICDESVALG
jgi:hypothetical protein